MKKLFILLLALGLVGCTPKPEDPPTQPDDPGQTEKPEDTTTIEKMNLDDPIVVKLLEPFVDFNNEFTIEYYPEATKYSWTMFYDENMLGYDRIPEDVKLVMAMNETLLKDDVLGKSNYQDTEVDFAPVNAKVKEIFGNELDITKIEREGTQLYHSFIGSIALYDDVANTLLIKPLGHGGAAHYSKVEVMNAQKETYKIDDKTSSYIKVDVKVAFLLCPDFLNEENPNRIYKDSGFKTELDNSLETIDMKDYLDQLDTFTYTFKLVEGQYIFDSVEKVK